MIKRNITIKNKYLLFPICNTAKKCKVWLYENGEVLYDLDLRLSKNYDYLTWLDTENMMGTELTFSCEEDGVVDVIMQGDELPSGIYQEEYRPHYHFTPICGWVNDPNGLVYANGKYHMFYQYNPYDTRWGNMHWGHSVSTDMMNWKHVGITLFPDTLGTMYSGSAVYDFENISGLGTKENPPILLYYTCAGGDNLASAGKPFTICLAYSCDDGKTFKKYQGNPVVNNICFADRDPKVIYDKQHGKWIMALYLIGHDFTVLSSNDLFNWKQESVFTCPTMNECPDLFPILGTDKWGMLAGADYWGHKSVAKYVTGNFDGKNFTNISEPHVIDFGKDLYSLQTFDNDPENRRVMMGWRTRNFYTPAEDGMSFNGEYSIPTELTSCTINGELRLKRYPVKEFFQLNGEIVFESKEDEIDARFCDKLVVNQNVGESYYIELSFKPKDNALVTFYISGEKVVYNTEMQTLELLERNVFVPLESDGSVNILILHDTVSLEVFAQDGKYPVSDYIYSKNNIVKGIIYRGTISDFTCKIKKINGIFKK